MKDRVKLILFLLRIFPNLLFFNPLFHFILLAENKRRICLSCLWADLLPCSVVAQSQLAICCCIALALKHPKLYSWICEVGEFFAWWIWPLCPALFYISFFCPRQRCLSVTLKQSRTGWLTLESGRSSAVYTGSKLGSWMKYPQLLPTETLCVCVNFSKRCWNFCSKHSSGCIEWLEAASSGLNRAKHWD